MNDGLYTGVLPCEASGIEFAGGWADTSFTEYRELSEKADRATPKLQQTAISRVL